MFRAKREKIMEREEGGRIRKRSPRHILTADVKIDYKNIGLLQKFLTDRGKILSRRVTGITGKQQRALMISVKRAKFLDLLPVGSSKKR